jgi:transposase
MTVKQDSETAAVSTIGVDLGDKYSRVCVLDRGGEIVEEGRIPTSPSAFTRRFKTPDLLRIVLETGTHANWVHDLLVGLGHEVLVANARKVRAISANERKCDELDARMLARLGRADTNLLQPVEVRPAQLRTDLCRVRAREALVAARTMLVNSARGLAKSMGARLPSSSTNSLHRKELDAKVKLAIRPLMSAIEGLTARIKACDKELGKLSEKRYPQTARLRQIKGVGPITSLYFVLAIADPCRFKDPRSVGVYFGIVPRRDQSGDHDPKLRISKCGDPLARKLLVQCAHHILGRFGVDSDLRRFGQRLAAQGGKQAKKRAVVATARKLAVLLFVLLRKGEVYEPLRSSVKGQAA